MSQPAKLLRIYVTEHDQYGGKPLYEAIVDRCRELNVAGATVFRAMDDLLIVITIVESPEKVQQILPELEGMMNSGMIAITEVEVTIVSNRVRQ